MATRYNYRPAGILKFYESTSQETVKPCAPVLLEDDFLGALDANKWLILNNAGAESQVKIANQHGGVFGLILTNAIAKQFSGLYAGDRLEFNLDKGPIFEARVSLHGIPTLLAEAYFGLANAHVEGPLSTDGPSVHACFNFDGSGLAVIDCDDDSHDTAATTTDVTVLVDVFHVYKIDFTTIADVLFYIDGVRVASGTAFDMSNGLNIMVQPYFMVHKESDAGGATVASMYIDYVRVWNTR